MLSACDATCSASGELIIRQNRRDGVAVRLLPRQGREGALDLAPDTAHRNSEHALTASNKVNDLIGTPAFVDGDAITHEGHPGEILAWTGSEMIHGGPDIRQADTSVDEVLDDSQNENVAEPIESLTAGSRGCSNCRLNKASPSPVIELSVGDASDRARDWPSVADTGWKGAEFRVIEQRALRILSDVRTISVHKQPPRYIDETRGRGAASKPCSADVTKGQGEGSIRHTGVSGTEVWTSG